MKILVVQTREQGHVFVEEILRLVFLEVYFGITWLDFLWNLFKEYFLIFHGHLNSSHIYLANPWVVSLKSVGSD